jgi:plasmid stability protein
MLALLSLLAMTAQPGLTTLMATITIRNLDEKIKRRLQVRAAINGRSMEAEARELISGQLTDVPAEPRVGLGTAIHRGFAALGNVELELPPRPFSSSTPISSPEDAPERIESRPGLGTQIHNLFAPLGGVDLQLPPRRKSHRQIPTFE